MTINFDDIKYETKLIRNPLKKKSDNMKETAYQWLVTVNGQSFDYFTGSGLVINTQKIYQNERPKTPSLKDVLYSLVMDSDACEMPFDSWCSNFGYNTDSRKALETYLACQENTLKLRNAKIDLSAIREALQDY